MAEEVTLNEVLNFENTLLAELKAMAGIDTEITLADINQLYKPNILLLLRQIKEQGTGTGTGGTGLTTTQSTALSALITALNANKVLSDNNYSASEKNKVADSFQKLSNTSDDILEGVTHLFLTAEERAKISNAFLLNENTDILTEGNMNLFVTPAEKAKWNGNRTVYPVPNITERDKLITNPPAGVTVRAGDKAFVLDDGDGKHAEYTYTGSMWLKTGDPDWANVITDWANIANKPTTISGYGISDAVDTSTSQIIAGTKTFSGIAEITGTAKISGWLIVGGYGATGISGFRNFYGYNSSSLLKFTTNTTGQTTTDGLDVGITSDGTGEIRQRENKPLNIYTNNALAATFGADKSLTLPDLAGTGTRTVVANSAGKLTPYCTDVKLILNLVSWVPVSTGISINGGYRGMTYMLYYSSQWDTGNNTFSGIYMLRCGYNGNNFSVNVISESGDSLYTPAFSQVEGILHITGVTCGGMLRAVAIN